MFDKPGSHLRNWSLAFGFWTLLALSFTLRQVFGALLEGNTVPWHRALAWNLTDYYLWMALTPAVIWLGRRTAERGWRHFLALHIPASIVAALLQATIMLAIYWPLRGTGPHADISFAALYRIEFVEAFQLALVTYWVLLVVLRGIEHQRRLRDEKLRASRLETQLAQSQLQALRMQLQPHFLFNTLNAISALTLSDPSRARLMIARLGDFLRLTLKDRHLQQVPLSHELKFLERYLAIQQVRFADRLTARFDIAENTLQASVPNMILQPLVENALHHGLLPKSGAGTLRLTTRRKGDDLSLLIEDDGLGLPDTDHCEGIGLGNTRARLQALFDAAANLDLTRIASGGTRVELRFPFQEYAP